MPIVIKEMHVRTVVERKIITETEISEDVIRKMEERIVDRLLDNETLQSVRHTHMQTRKKNER
ncbi:MAG: hypothetical protein K5874_00810 [Bacteroidaceae bacterium]|nr:hypothetical protein [Bacteroidaceae bacterium]MBR4589869.1 hypothetical protein [Bacteroidaceae bacterium]MCR4768749.1 hypothetical protein [Bacteroidaceae bacterium]